MRYIKLFNIKLNQIQIFLAAAEYKNFSMAAERLHMTQPMVSKTITSLENELGIILFVRTHGKLQITPAGQLLVKEWATLIKNFENSLENAHALQEGQKNIFRIGLSQLTSNIGSITENARRLRGTNSGLKISFEVNDMNTLQKRLTKNELDLILISKHLLPNLANTNLKWRVVSQSFLSAFIHKSNPLFYRDAISLADLRSETFIVASQDQDAQYSSLLNEVTKKAGFVPQVCCHVSNELSLKANLLLGNGIVLADDMTDLEDEEIRKFVFPEFRNDIIAVWKANDPNTYADEFLSFF